MICAPMPKSRRSISPGVAGAALAGLVHSLPASQTFYVAYAALGLITAVIPLFLSAAVGGSAPSGPVFGSIRPLLVLSGLFALVSFGGGFVVPSVLVYWLHRWEHSVPLLWRVHAVHHGSQEIRWWTSYRFHPIDTALSIASVNVHP